MDEAKLQTKLSEIKQWLQREYAGIRTGQANPSLLDNIKVESYGSLLPLNQVGSIGVEDARTLRIAPWDTSQIAAVEQALQEADLGLSVATDSNGVRAIFPELTAERRTQLTKLAKSKLEDARISVRSARDESMKEIDQAEKAGAISEDEKFSRKEQVQKLVDATNKELEALADRKEGELSQ